MDRRTLIATTVAAVSAPAAAAGCATSTVSTGGDREQRNLAIVLAANEAMNRGDLETYVSYWIEDTQNFGRSVGRSGILDRIRDIFTTFPDYRHDILQTIAKDDSVVLRLTASGTHRGVGRFPLNGGMLVGAPPTQRRFEVQHIHWYTLRDGKIATHTANRDDLGLMRQLGLIPDTVSTQ